TEIRRSFFYICPSTPQMYPLSLHDALPIYLELEGVDGAVARDHPGRVLGVALEQRVEGVPQGFLGLARHREELGLELGELVVKVAVSPGAWPRGRLAGACVPTHPNRPVM